MQVLSGAVVYIQDHWRECTVVGSRGPAIIVRLTDPAVSNVYVITYPEEYQ